MMTTNSNESARKFKKNNILVKSNAKNRWEIIEEMIDLAVKNKEISHEDSDTFKNALIEREKINEYGHW